MERGAGLGKRPRGGLILDANARVA